VYLSKFLYFELYINLITEVIEKSSSLKVFDLDKEIDSLEFFEILISGIFLLSLLTLIHST